MTAQTNGRVRDTLEPEIVRVIEAFDEIVRPEGGSVSLVAIEGRKLRVAYVAGVNEDCPTCVMEPDALGLMMHDMLREHAPEIEEVVVVVATPGGGA
jgi:Fe-S cluster biogenesis protein NfuA